VVTVPMIGFVARDKLRTSVGADEAGLPARLGTRFVESVPRKGAPFAVSPDTTDGRVYQDEFIHQLAVSFPGAFAAGAPRPLFVSLDNEPDMWGSTHAEIRSPTDDKARLLTYDELITSTIAYAAAIKDVAPGALVFGPAVGTWAGAANLGRWPKPDPTYKGAFFLETYLDQMREAERRSGRRLVDVLDLHFYPELKVGSARINSDRVPQTDSLVDARLQSPRSLWDPTYDERSWVSSATGGPVKLLPRLRAMIAQHYPGTKIAITEYYYGRAGDISGGLAQADVLGVFGREGVFAAALWPNADVGLYAGNANRAYAYVVGAFQLFRDYDGQGHAFGDVGLRATTSRPITTAVYASQDADDSTRVVLIAINTRRTEQEARVHVASPRRFSLAQVYVLSDGSPTPARATDLVVGAGNATTYRMPPLSASVLVLRP
jgi:hypothetical protein